MPLPLQDQLCFGLYAANLAVTRSYKPMLDAMGMTYPQYLVLVALGEADGLSISGIATRLGLEPSTVTPLVKRMEQAGRLVRQRARTDERMVQVYLTEAGRAALADSACLNDALVRSSGMTLADLGRLNTQLRRLLAALAATEAELDTARLTASDA